MWNKINCCLCSRYKKNYKKICKYLHQIPWKDAQCGCRKLRPCHLNAWKKIWKARFCFSLNVLSRSLISTCLILNICWVFSTALACRKTTTNIRYPKFKIRHVQMDELLRTLDFNKFTGPAEGAKIRGCPET